MDKGTIIYIGGFELPDKNAAAHRVIANGKLLRDVGYNVHFMGISNERIYSNKTFYGFNSSALKYPNSIISWFEYITTFKNYIKLIESYSNVHSIICYNLPSGSLYRLLKYCKKKEIKIFSDCTEWYIAPKTGNFLARTVKSWDIKLRMNNLHIKLDGVIAISSFLDTYYSNQGVKTLQIPPLIDKEDSKWPTNILLKTNTTVNLIYSGSPFALTKGSEVKDRLDLIIDGLYLISKTFKDFKLTILGMDLSGFLIVFPDYKDKLLSLGELIDWKGRVPHNEALDLLKKSDFSIFLRDTNLVTTAGFPTKFVEALSCGIPVLTNRNSNLADYLIEGKNGFWIDTSSEDSVYDSLSEVFKINKNDLKILKESVLEDKIFDYRSYMTVFENFLK
ncbi:glycosyltransferase involved in cell wall biosynthesis [Dokdonia sp. Hel_I_63]|uniref:glycosyltransferase n=1 Tax=Dokdonia sp. Hel_I_63 TaxID=1249996 RepID=UPI00119AB1B5|nr:glycosyltransferase [Dokdonia sp. Hel_I_63]TVZ23005.1 glycosyltransferase involved in cell wall biosynthesis [Dokdonia sp. Hel_I_63]